MKYQHRKILFIFFVTLFLISAPLLVLYTAGYRYSPLSGTIVRTGVLSTSTEPRGASILLDGEPINRSTPYVVKQLIPGTYELTFQRDGYHDWNGEVVVESGRTTIAQHILLFRNEEPRLLTERIDTSLDASPNGKTFVYATQEGGWLELWTYDIATGQETMVGRFVGSSEDPFQLDWSTQGGYLLVQNAPTDLLTVFSKDGEQIELTSQMTKGWNKVFWHPETDHLLYVSTAKELRQIDLRDGSTMVLENENVATVVLDASIITFIDNGTQVEVRQSVGEENTLIALLPRGTYQIEARDGEYLLLTDNRNNIYMLDIRADQPLLLNTYATIFDWSEQTKQLVYSDGYEVNVYDPGSHTTQFITRQGDEIQSIEWHVTGQAILVATTHNLTAIERHQIASQRQKTTLIEGDLYAFWTSADGRIAYIYGMMNDTIGLYELRLTR